MVCKSRLRDDQIQARVTGVLERELLDPARLRALERHEQELLVSRRKEVLKARTDLETRLARVKEEEHAQLRAIASGIDPLVVKEVVDELQQEERKITEKLRGLQGEPDAAHALAAVRLLRDHAADLRAVLRDGDPHDQRNVFVRTVSSVKWLPEEAHLEIRLRLPQQENEETAGSGRYWCGSCTCPGSGTYRIHTG